MAKKSKPDKRTISEMRNLGPACEKDLNAVGIRTASQLIRLGPEDAFVKMLLGRKRLGRSAKCCNAASVCPLRSDSRYRLARVAGEEEGAVQSLRCGVARVGSVSLNGWFRQDLQDEEDAEQHSVNLVHPVQLVRRSKANDESPHRDRPSYVKLQGV